MQQNTKQISEKKKESKPKNVVVEGENDEELPDELMEGDEFFEKIASFFEETGIKAKHEQVERFKNMLISEYPRLIDG